MRPLYMESIGRSRNRPGSSLDLGLIRASRCDISGSDNPDCRGSRILVKITFVGKALLLVALAALLSCRAAPAPVAEATSSASQSETTAAAPEQSADATSAASAAEGTTTTEAPKKPLITINPWNLALGPLFIAAWGLFGLGFAWRAYRFARLTRAVPRAKLFVQRGAGASADHPRVLAFGFRHWLRRTIFGTNPVMGVVSLVFHVLLFLVPLLLPAHADLIRQSTGAVLPTLPAEFLDRMTLVLMVFGGFFLLRRILVPRVRALTTLRDYLILLLVAAPFVSAYLAHHHVWSYHTVVLVHMLIGDLVIAAVPWTKLGHMPFLILSRFFLTGERAWKPGNRQWVDRRAAG